MIIQMKRAGEKISFALCRSNASHPDVAFASHPYVTQPYCALLQYNIGKAILILLNNYNYIYIIIIIVFNNHMHDHSIFNYNIKTLIWFNNVRYRS
jgi:hypothetical protein